MSLIFFFTRKLWKSIVLFKYTFKGNSIGLSGKSSSPTPVVSGGHSEYLVKLLNSTAEHSAQWRGGARMNPLASSGQFSSKYSEMHGVKYHRKPHDYQPQPELQTPGAIKARWPI